MSMVPGAAYLSMLVGWARGDLRYSASALLLTCLGIVVFVPLVLPNIVAGVSVSAWAIARVPNRNSPRLRRWSKWIQPPLPTTSRQYWLVPERRK